MTAMVIPINKPPKVLVCCPTSDKKSYCDEMYFNVLDNLTYSNYAVFIADNSDTIEYFEKLKKRGYNAEYISPIGKNSNQILCESHNACRRYALDNGYDYMMHIESDIKPPCNDIIEKLLAHKKPVVSACYPTGPGNASWFLFQKIDKELEKLLPNFPIVTNLEEGQDLWFIDGSLKEIFACGLGCALISREVFEKIPFEYNDSDFHPDSFFYMRMYQEKIKNYVDTSLICEHKNMKWSVLGGLGR